VHDVPPQARGPAKGGGVTIDRRWKESVTTARPLNVVHDSICPQCLRPGSMTVWVACVEWVCGHTRVLPSLPSQLGAPGRKAVR
jgi:hypothetical protein